MNDVKGRRRVRQTYRHTGRRTWTTFKAIQSLICKYLWRSCWSIVSLFRWVSLTIHCIYIMFLFVIVLPVCLVVPFWHRPTFLWWKWNKQFTNQRLHYLKGCFTCNESLANCSLDLANKARHILFAMLFYIFMSFPVKAIFILSIYIYIYLYIYIYIYISIYIYIYIYVWGSGGRDGMLVAFTTACVSWRSVVLIEETGENNRPFVSHWQTLSHDIVSSTARHGWCSNSQR
jgi:hypothetical protein